MTWNLFKTKSQRSGSPLGRSGRHGQQATPVQSTSMSASASSTSLRSPASSKRRPPVSEPSIPKLKPKPRLNLESNPLSGMGPTLSPANYYSAPSPHQSSQYHSQSHYQFYQTMPETLMSPSVRRSSSHSSRSIRSVPSVNSTGPSSSSRSLRSGAMSLRTRHIKAAAAAKRAAAAYMATNRGKSMICYTCGHEFFEIRCGTCRTAYIPPEFRYSPASAAMFEGMDLNHLDRVFGGALSGPTLTTTKQAPNSPQNQGNVMSSGSSLSGQSVGESIFGTASGAASLIGFLPETEADLEPTTTKLDMDLIKDLANCDEPGLLEEVIFECFSNPDAVVNTFSTKSPHYSYINHEFDFPDPTTSEKEFRDVPEPHSVSDLRSNADVRSVSDTLSGGDITATYLTSTNSSVVPLVPPKGPSVDNEVYGTPAQVSSLDTEYHERNQPIIDCKAVQMMYDLLASVSSTSPMRGILQGAQAALQTRKHAPITESELVYISVVLQCPAITDCSMFTKITGPMQKLSRYASLRSRARTVLETCAGLVAHSDDSLHPMFAQVFATLDKTTFNKIVDICNGYISHRLSFDFTDKSSSASSRPTKFQLVKYDWYSDDWRITVVVKLLTLFWTANGMQEDNLSLLPAYTFYNLMVDFIDLKADFDSWQMTRSFRKPKFCFCRYPFLLSIGTKAKVFEYAVQREVNATIQREMFAMMSRSRVNQSLETQQMQLTALRTLLVRVRRTHLLQDSVEQLQSWPTSKRRALKVEFEGEPGIDAGGLKKEWFHMFYKQIFDPELKVFVMDESSNYCWFGTHPDLRYYQAAGTALGLALFNGVTIDLNLPRLLFKLLLDYDFDLNNVGALWPEISQSLQSIMDYDNEDFEEVFGLTFTAPDDTPLIADGEKINVTLASKQVYVKLLVDHLINIESQPLKLFKEAFTDVCGGNAMTLFLPEELELLVRGDRRPIDVQALRSVTKYVNFGHRYEKANNELVVQWFWDYFEKLDPLSQGRLLQFVTSTDRAPAAGMVHMRFSIRCLGGDSERLPIAHTCFNELCLYKYKSRKKLERKLSVAIVEYQGFGLK